MSKPMKTPWFQNASPIRPGVYRTSATWGKGFDTWVNRRYSYWDGREWFARTGSPKLARQAHKEGKRPVAPPVAWRGVVSGVKA